MADDTPSNGFDFGRRQARLAELIESGCPSVGHDQLVTDCIAGGHRRQFFVRDGIGLRRQGLTLFNGVKNHKLVSDRAMPSIRDWQDFCLGRELGLRSILKIDDALDAFAKHKSLEVRNITSVGGRPFTLEAKTVVPSVFYAPPSDLMEYRSSKYSNREALSRDIFASGRYTMQFLERGDDRKNAHYRVTWHTVSRMADFMGTDVAALFTSSADQGPRRGESTYALPLANGNLTAPRPHVMATSETSAA